MSPKQSRQGSKHHHRRHSYQPKSIASSRTRRGRSRSGSSGRARSCSPLLRSHVTPPARLHSQSRSRLRSKSRSRLHSKSRSRIRSKSRSRLRKHRQPVHTRDIPIYIPSSEHQTHAIPIIIAEALRQQEKQSREALTTANNGYRLPTPPPEPTTQVNTKTLAPSSKRRPSSSPAAAKARRRRRPRPRPRQQSEPSERDEPILPPRPEPIPSHHAGPPPYSFFGIIKVKGEKEKREAIAKKKRDEERRRKRKEAEEVKRKKDDGDGGDRDDTPQRPQGPSAESSMPPLQRATSAPPLSRSPIYEEQPYDGSGDQLRTASRRGHRHKGKQQRRKKHHRRPAEQPHRRQKRRSRYAMRDFFASLRRKLGNLLRLTLPAANPPPQPPPPRVDVDYSTPTREPAGGPFYGGEDDAGELPPFPRRSRKSGERRSAHPLPYFMHGGRSPADSWHSRLSRPRSTRRFTTTVESAPGSGTTSPRGPTWEFPRPPTTTAAAPERFSHHSSGSTISIIARRFMGPFFSEPSDAPTLDGGAAGQWRLSWRSYKLLTAGSRPATPPSSRNPSPSPSPSLGPEGRGRSGSREKLSVPGAYRSSSSMGLRSLYASSPDRRSRSASPYRVATPEYGLADVFATPRVSSPVSTASMRIASSDYGLQRMFATPPAASSGSNFGLRRLFSEG